MSAKILEATIKRRDSRIVELEGEIALLQRNSSLLNDRVERADSLASALIGLSQLVADAGDVRQYRQWLDAIEAICLQMSRILEGAADKVKGGAE